MNVVGKGLTLADARPVTHMSGPDELLPLTSLRFFAAAAIVYLHIQGPTFGLPQITNFALGQGVSFFFILSGFILTYRYPDLRGRDAVWDFLVRRFARIWPAHVIGLIVALVLVWRGTFGVYDVDAGIYHLVAAVLLIQTWTPISAWQDSVNGPAWSISVEFLFYLLFPLLIRDFTRTWHWKLAASLGVALSLCLYGNLHDLSWGKPGEQGVDSSSLIYYFAPARAFEFVLGMCAALLWNCTLRDIKLRSAIWTMIEVLAVSAVLYASHVSAKTTGSTFNNWLSISGIISGPAAFLIVVMASSRGVLARLLGFRPLAILGEISYSIYLLHYSIAHYLTSNKHAGTQDWVALIFLLACILGAAFLSWKYAEKPLRRKIIAAGS